MRIVTELCEYVFQNNSYCHNASYFKICRSFLKITEDNDRYAGVFKFLISVSSRLLMCSFKLDRT